MPGSEGEGVSDVLFGDAPFTGRLPVTWPRSVDQEPINVGDGQHPAFPYGWGLRTRGSHGGGHHH
ncbi:glycoside hydrolase family 3 C-terminal domain-containing protein [Phycicoccus sp. HDW14]|uniref:glycoside hydrolase family 3 C-terminal domain-containing protein n=1 Tax=Phycicoccus sp. HDW14 TaxID=2714941 RepID=UPI00210F8360|nr:glycoside hydrolase family 3 C-terminal domain-containing protein [Phycicoccus sp. HDW14]